MKALLASALLLGAMITGAGERPAFANGLSIATTVASSVNPAPGAVKVFHGGWGGWHGRWGG